MAPLFATMLESWSPHREQEAAQGRAKDDVTRTHVKKQTSGGGKTPHASETRDCERSGTIYFHGCSALVVTGMAANFRLQEEEPQLLTDTEQQEHFGNESARTTRARLNRFRIIRIAPGNTTFGVI
ncbi:hypothetical protein GGD63_005779 [Bradyrhizobium sp. cir1]|uniref:hypothetical protein n=1 Tax=Bradyrhizobium sp. cir1 TaxID=1445730 RepID=UPI0016063DA8|nr:hypothetical protein [Bradyrhizobium sp. cir1]MBB4372964.1 hypothetical protein [Bradyrhizobium sp. cir1]